MTKADLIQQVQVTKGLPQLSKKDTSLVVDAVFEALKASLKKEQRFSYPGFGTFNVKERKARTGRNPRTGDSIEIGGSKTVSFKPSPTFKDGL
ncbi:MAG: DNA-binding protein [Myxococcales bacterium]